MKSVEERINLALQREFRTLNEESYHYLTDNRGPIDHQLTFFTEYSENLNFNSQTLLIQINIFNTGSIARTYDLIKKIKKHFSNRIFRVGGEFILKFPPEHPVRLQRNVETGSNEIRHFQLEMEARVIYDAKPRQDFQITNI